ncbi:MAG: Dam family site-specific DNA-(adenine-N6)-methyltransferase [Acidobacteria bacterium]|nr:Dam family site-specific DNA-(adenine-N6)-methyltransferase [Acidobacteriota bacterium]
MAHGPTAIDVTPAARRPPLKWAGGKRWLVPHIRPLWAPHQTSRLVEPFCGGLAVALGLAPQRALLNDINPHLINIYRHLKRGLTIRLEMENDSAAFYAHRLRFNDLLAAGKTRTIEAASLFYYLNRTGYNGLCRFNSRGQFNVPFGRYKRITYARDFDRYADIFDNWEFRSADFERLRLRADDFVYADPPYDVPFTQYARGGFSWSDQVRLAEWLVQHPGPVVLSNQATPRIVALYERLGYALKFLAAPRRISCTGDRAPAREVLATRNL